MVLHPSRSGSVWWMGPGGCFHVCPFEQIAEFAPETITLGSIKCTILPPVSCLDATECTGAAGSRCRGSLNIVYLLLFCVFPVSFVFFFLINLISKKLNKNNNKNSRIVYSKIIKYIIIKLKKMYPIEIFRHTKKK